MTIRKIIFWLHLIAGISAGIVVLIMSLTGVLLTYEKQMIAWADRGFRQEAPPPDATRLPLDVLVSKVQESGGAAPTTMTFYADSRTVAAAIPGNTLYVDAYSGSILGTESVRLRSFFRYVTSWHRYLALTGESRPVGKALTGAGNLIFLFIVASGLFIWFPRGKWTRQSLRAVTWFRGGLSPKARNWNWHNTFGFWAAIPLALVVVSATVISYPWATNLVYRVTGTEPPAPAGERQQAPAVQAQQGRREGQAAREGAGQNREATPEIDITGVDPLIARAEQHVPGWKIISLRLPASGDAPLTFNIDRGNGGQPQLRSTVTLDRKTGEVTRQERFEDQNTGRRARSWLRFVHTGEYYGFTGQTIAGIASFAGVMLVWTGFALSWKRFRAWAAARGQTLEKRAMPDSAREGVDRVAG